MNTLISRMKPFRYRVGDIVSGTKQSPLRSGAEWYPYAFVVSDSPPVLVSEEGDMLWGSTVSDMELVWVGYAEEEDMEKPLARWERDKHRYVRAPELQFPDWIKITKDPETLPPDGQIVQLFEEQGGYGSGYRVTGHHGDIWCYKGQVWSLSVSKWKFTHWMPKPPNPT